MHKSAGPRAGPIVTEPRTVVTIIATRLSQLTVDGQVQASNIVYNAASQTTKLKVGAAGTNQITETYDYDSQTGLRANQKVLRGPDPPPTQTTLLDLDYQIH